MWFRAARILRNNVRGIMASQSLVKAGIFSGIGVLLFSVFELSLGASAAAVLAAYLATGGWRFAKVVLMTLPRDLRGLSTLIYLKRQIASVNGAGGDLTTMFRETVKRHPHKLAFVLVDGRAMTFQEVEDYSNAVGNYLYANGYRQGDVIAMFMENCAEYPALWLGMAKVGVVAALINFNLRKESLAHCIKASGAKGIVFSSDLSSAVHEIRDDLSHDVRLYNFGEETGTNNGSIHINSQIAASSRQLPPQEHLKKFNDDGTIKQGLFNDKLFYVYTSGTTGLPKAAVVVGSRFFYMAMSTHIFFKMSSDDVIYDTLPLYHTAGGILGVGQALINGCTVVIRKKFSASRFWDDCVKYNCTVTQYIGEICRYLLAQPHRVAEDQHRVRVAFGNGLRPQIWVQFKQRFRIERIGEFYGATEGNCNIVNIDNTVGSVGFVTRIAPSLYPVTLIKVDEATGEPIRGPDGLCVKCKPGEQGELVGKIVKGDPIRAYDGYSDKGSSKKKVAYDVFHKGDSVFLTGDVLSMDEYGYMFFKDRTGDTFRWRGENVSTSEVEATVSNVVKLNDAVCYGVEVPGVEGRAGMVAIVDETKSINLKMLYTELSHKLPAYARPIFIRILTNVDTTGTFKLRKVDYRKDGIDPSKSKDTLYYLDAKAAEYKELTEKIYEDIKLGKIRF